MSSEIKLPNGAKKPIAIADEATAYTLTSVPVGNVYKTNDTGQLMEYRGGGEGTPENWWITRNTNSGDQDLTYIDEELVLRAKVINSNTDLTTLETDGDYLYIGNEGGSDVLLGVTVCTDVTVINLTADDVLISDLDFFDAVRIEPLQEVKFSTVPAGAETYSFSVSSRKDLVAYSVDKATAKATPVDADLIGITDSADSKALKKLSWANLKATLKTYFDALYVSLTSNQTIAGEKTFTGQMQATGQAATDGDSLMTLELVNDSSIRRTNSRVFGAFIDNNSGAGSSGVANSVGLGYGVADAGTALGGYASLGYANQPFSNASGNPIPFNTPWKISGNFLITGTPTTAEGVKRFIVGSHASAITALADSDAFTSDAIGIEIGANPPSSGQWARIIYYGSSVYSQGDWFQISTSTDPRAIHFSFLLECKTAGVFDLTVSEGAERGGAPSLDGVAISEGITDGPTGFAATNNGAIYWQACNASTYTADAGTIYPSPLTITTDL